MKHQSFSTLRAQAGYTIQDIADLTGYALRTVYRWESRETEPRKSVYDMLLMKIRASQEVSLTRPTEFTFIDLFAGIGGMRKGFESIDGECVFTSEWNKFSRLTYQINYPCNHLIAGDITQVDEKDIPKHDVLLAGFPCQPFSLAGVSKKNSLSKPHGFEDKTQGTLFFDIARIISHHRPEAFLLENVKNLRSHNKGRTFQIIKEVLEDELGYTTHDIVIDAKRFVPQHRERVFIVGFKNKNSFDFDKLELPSLEDHPRLSSILHPEDGSEESEAPYTLGDLAEVNPKYTLTPRLWEYLQEYAEKHRLKGNGFGFGLTGVDGTARTLSARYHKDGSEILIRQKNNRPRRLTPRECARLMGYDFPGEPLFEIPVSDTQAYKQFGNGVVVPVVKAIAEHMKPYLIKKGSEKGSTSPREMSAA